MASVGAIRALINQAASIATLRSVVKSIQHGSITITTTATSGTATVTAVTTANCILLYLGHSIAALTSATTDSPAIPAPKLTITNTTTITATRIAPANNVECIVQFCLVEFNNVG